MISTEHMADFFRGMARRNRAAVEDASTFKAWRELAQQRLDRRRERILDSLTDDELAAVASGQIDLRAAAHSALRAL